MDTVLIISTEDGQNIFDDSKVNQPLHVQNESKSQYYRTKYVSESDTASSSTSCTNPHLKELLDRYFPSDDDYWQTDVESDTSEDSEDHYKKDRRQLRNSQVGNDTIDNLSTKGFIASQPMTFPIQCLNTSCKQNHEWLTEARRQNFVREERCRGAIQAISATLRAGYEYDSGPSSIDDSSEENMESCPTESQVPPFGISNQISPSNDSNDGAEMLADLELTRRARKIQHDLRLQEIEELAWEAERAAEAGNDKFVGVVTTFGINEVTPSSSPSITPLPISLYDDDERMVSFRTPNKSNCGRRNLQESYQSCDRVRIVTPKSSSPSCYGLYETKLEYSNISPPPEVKRFTQVGTEKPKPLSFQNRLSSAPSKMQNPDSTPISSPLTMKFRSAFQVPDMVSRQKIRVMSLRHVEEVIPTFMNMQNNLRLNMIRCGVHDEVLQQKIDKSVSDATNVLLDDKEESCSLSHVSSFSFFHKADNFHKLFSLSGKYNLVIGDESRSRTGDDSLDNSLLYPNESFALSPDRMIDDTIDCVSFVSCGGTSRDEISQQILVTPQRKLHIVDDEKENDAKEGVFYSILASEIHTPGRRSARRVSPPPRAPYDIGEYYKSDELRTTSKPHEVDSPSQKSRWSSFWDNLTPKKKVFTSPPLLLPSNLASSSLIRRTLSVLEGKKTELKRFAEDINFMESEKAQVQSVLVEEVKENLPPSTFRKAAYFESSIFEATPQSFDSVLATNTPFFALSATQNHREPCQNSGKVVCSKKQLDNCDVNFNHFTKTENTITSKDVLLCRSDWTGELNCEIRDAYASSDDTIDFHFNSNTKSEGMQIDCVAERILPKVHESDLLLKPFSEKLADAQNQIKTMNITSNNLIESRLIPPRDIAIFSDKPPLYPVSIRVANCLMNLNQSLPLEGKAVPLEPSSCKTIQSNTSAFTKKSTGRPLNSCASFDKTSMENGYSSKAQHHCAESFNERKFDGLPGIDNDVCDFSIRCRTVNNANKMEDSHAMLYESECPTGLRSIVNGASELASKSNISSQVVDDGLIERRKEIQQRQVSVSSSLQRSPCMGDEYESGTERICEGAQQYTAAPPLEDRSGFIGIIDKVPSFIGRLSPLLGGKHTDCDEENRDLAFVRNYFYVGINPKSETCTQPHKSDDNEHASYQNEFCGSNHCNNLSWNIHLALLFPPAHNDAALDEKSNRHTIISNQPGGLVNAARESFDNPFFQRKTIKCGSQTFLSPSLHIKQTRFYPLESQSLGKQIIQLDSSKQSIPFSDLKSHHDVNMDHKHSNTQGNVHWRRSQSIFHTIEENWENIIHLPLPNEIEVTPSMDGLEKNLSFP